MPQIAVGDEGYLVGGSTWYDNGSKGTDWGAMLQDPNIAFGTVHICAAPRCRGSLLPCHLPDSSLATPL